MKRSTKEYVDQQISWVRDIKKTENYWLEKYLDTKGSAEKEERKAFNDMIEGWKRDQNEWRERVEQIISQGVTRKEMRATSFAIITILLTFLGVLISIFVKK
jgi:hypothetical protein